MKNSDSFEDINIQKNMRPWRLGCHLLLTAATLTASAVNGSLEADDSFLISGLDTDITQPSYEEILYKHFPRYSYRFGFLKGNILFTD